MSIFDKLGWTAKGKRERAAKLRYCPECGSKVEVLTMGELFDTETGEPITMRYVVRCPKCIDSDGCYAAWHKVFYNWVEEVQP